MTSLIIEYIFKLHALKLLTKVFKWPILNNKAQLPKMIDASAKVTLCNCGKKEKVLFYCDKKDCSYNKTQEYYC